MLEFLEKDIFRFERHLGAASGHRRDGRHSRLRASWETLLRIALHVLLAIRRHAGHTWPLLCDAHLHARNHHTLADASLLSLLVRWVHRA